MDLSLWQLDDGRPFLLDASDRSLGPGAKRGLRRDGVFESGALPEVGKHLKGEQRLLAISHNLAAELGETQPTIEVALCSFESYRVVQERGVTQPFKPSVGRPAAPALASPSAPAPP